MGAIRLAAPEATHLWVPPDTPTVVKDAVEFYDSSAALYRSFVSPIAAPTPAPTAAPNS